MKQKDHLDSDDFMQKMKRTVALREDCGIFLEQEFPRPVGELFYAIEDQKLVRKDEKPAGGYIQIVSKAEFAQQFSFDLENIFKGKQVEEIVAVLPNYLVKAIEYVTTKK